jgi:hypothetical protein
LPRPFKKENLFSESPVQKSPDFASGPFVYLLLHSYTNTHRRRAIKVKEKEVVKFLYHMFLLICSLEKINR